MAIAITKAVLIMMYFMHLKFSTQADLALRRPPAPLWLAILISFVLSDFLSRHWLRGPLITDPEAVALLRARPQPARARPT